jgi:hypothetical protein
LICIRTRTLLPLLLCYILSAPILATESDSTAFQVQDYIPERITDFEWRLDGELGIDRDARETSPNFPEGETSENVSRRADFDLALTNAWRYVYQTRQGLFDCDWSLTTMFDDVSTTGTISSDNISGEYSDRWSEYSDRGGRLEFSVGGEFRRHFLADLHVAAAGEGQYSYTHRKHESETARRSSGHETDPEVILSSRGGSIRWQRDIDRRIDFVGDVMVGWGRRYDGRHAVTAIQLVEELDRLGLAARRPDRQDLLGLTELVHRLREGHGPDDREYRTWALESLADYLIERGILQVSDAATILTIEDVWDFYPQTDRRFGWEIQIGYGGTHEYYNDQFDRKRSSWGSIAYDYPDTSSMADTVIFQGSRSENSGGVRYWLATHYYSFTAGWWRPLSARWQLDAHGWLRMHFDRRERPHNNTLFVNWRTAMASASLRYLHNARTELLFGTLFEYERRSDRHEFPGPDLDTQFRNWVIQLMSRVQYRLAVPTTLVVEWGYYRELVWTTAYYSQGSDTVRHGFDLSVGITHWLF